MPQIHRFPLLAIPKLWQLTSTATCIDLAHMSGTSLLVHQDKNQQTKIEVHASDVPDWLENAPIKIPRKAGGADVILSILASPDTEKRRSFLQVSGRQLTAF